MTPSRGIHRLAVALVAATFALLLAGGQVTSTESGDAVPTWPFPLRLPMVGGVLWELGHRQVAGLVGLLTLALAAWLFLVRRRPSAHPSSTVRLGAWALFLVLFQAALGGVRVLVGAKDPSAGTEFESMAVRAIAMVHASVAQLFLLLVVTLAVVTSPSWLAGQARPRGKIGRAATAAVLIGFAQIVLGALLRHARSDLTLGIHVAGALLVLWSVAVLSSRVLGADDADDLRRPARLLGLLLLAQIVLGIAAWMLTDGGAPKTPALTASAVIPSLHLLLGGGILATCRTIMLRSGRAPGAVAGSLHGVRAREASA